MILFLAFLLSNSVNATNWQTDFKSAQKIALATNRFILIDFWATWCGPCKKMDMDTWSNEEIIEITQDFVLLKIDIDSNRELAMQYGISSIPNMFIIDGNGKKLTSFLGYRSPNDLKKEIENYLLNTEFLSKELINVFTKNDFRNLAALIIKYYDYSLYVDKEINTKIIRLNREYLNDAKKKIDKKAENFQELSQKLELLNLYELAYLKKYEKLAEKLEEKFHDATKIAFANEISYYFLKYIALKGNNNSEVALFEEKLQQSDASFVIEKGNRVLASHS
ncbi:thioredoxin family protein [Flavobacterium sp. TSSA_36]|uniref:thioredoxin family protein n=1 Tax=Flavobacterium sp. TSSA_36 TaxID=3447669 RepID=UPI003F31FCE7